jgi:hypothetical protein
MGHKNEVPYDVANRQLNEGNLMFKEYFNCLQFAILARFLFGDDFQYFFFLGPFYTQKFRGCAVLDDGENVTKYDLVWGKPPASRDGDKYYVDPDYNRRWSYGLYLGGGVGKDLGPGKMTLDFRFGYGLIDLNKFDSKEDKQDAKDAGYKPYRGINAAITVAYLFPFGEK